MRFGLSDDQEFFRSTAEKFLAHELPRGRIREFVDGGDLTCDRELWARCGELGWTSIFVSESLGGGSISGNPLEDMSMIAEEAGRILAPLPLIGTNVVASAVSAGGSEHQVAEVLEPLMAGRAVAAWAMEEPGGCWRPDSVSAVAEVRGDQIEITGRKTLVQYGSDADHLLVTCRTGNGLTQVLVPSGHPGLDVRRLKSLDLLHQYTSVEFDHARLPLTAVLGEVGQAENQVARQVHVMTGLLLAETVGALAAAYEFTCEYGRNRYAFGRPILSFQALKHRLADMLVWLEACKGAAEAVAAIAPDDVDPAAVHAAKAYVGENGPALIQECIQIHGGIGLTWDHDLHLFLRRVTSNRALGGTPEQHREQICGYLQAYYSRPAELAV